MGPVNYSKQTTQMRACSKSEVVSLFFFKFSGVVPNFIPQDKQYNMHYKEP